MVPGTGPGRFKQRQSDERDGGTDGERSDKAHEEADEAGETDNHLQEGANHNGTLELMKEEGVL